MVSRLAAIGALLLLAACDEDGDGRTEVAHPWPADQRESFMESCVASFGTSESFCRCLLGLARIRFTSAEFDEIDDRMFFYGHDDDVEAFIAREGSACMIATGG